MVTCPVSLVGVGVARSRWGFARSGWAVPRSGWGSNVGVGSQGRGGGCGGTRLRSWSGIESRDRTALGECPTGRFVAGGLGRRPDRTGTSARTGTEGSSTGTSSRSPLRRRRSATKGCSDHQLVLESPGRQNGPDPGILGRCRAPTMPRADDAASRRCRERTMPRADDAASGRCRERTMPRADDAASRRCRERTMPRAEPSLSARRALTCTRCGRAFRTAPTRSRSGRRGHSAVARGWTRRARRRRRRRYRAPTRRGSAAVDPA